MPRKKKLENEDISLDLGLDSQDDFNLDLDELDDKSKSDNKKKKKYKKNEDKQEQQKNLDKEFTDMKKCKLKILYVEDNALVVDLLGWSKRVYFDLPFSQLEYIRSNKNNYKGKLVEVVYVGDLKDAFKVKILRLKNIDDIGSKY